MKMHTILIAEDHTILREGLKALLSDEPDFEIIGEAQDGQEAIRFANQLQPDLILMDLSMPHTNGTEAIGPIKRRNPGSKIIVLTVHKAEEYVRVALDAGADGYMLKDDTHQQLLSAIRSVLAGNIYLSPGICNKVVTGYLKPNSNSVCSWDRLTAREREVMKLIAEGNTNKSIASYLSVSLKTVEKHRASLMDKLGLRNSSSLTAYAMENGLV
jgi:DNA-binding NarL/FixJ family response regulator